MVTLSCIRMSWNDNRLILLQILTPCIIINRIVLKIEYVLSKEICKTVTDRILAQIIGNIQLKLALGDNALLYTKFMQSSVEKSPSWDLLFIINEPILSELNFWSNCLYPKQYMGRRLFSPRLRIYPMYTLVVSVEEVSSKVIQVQYATCCILIQDLMRITSRAQA